MRNSRIHYVRKFKIGNVFLECGRRAHSIYNCDSTRPGTVRELEGTQGTLHASSHMNLVTCVACKLRKLP